MRQYISESRAIYEDEYHGLFSRKLAKWAIGMMRDAEGKPLSPRSVDDVVEILKSSGVSLPDRYVYTAWYVYHMTIADYPKALPTDAVRAAYVRETIDDPDGDATNVLACFEAKMCNAGIPIYWDMML